MSKKQITSIIHWPVQDRPREKLLHQGEHTLSNSELLAILLRTGHQGQSALDLGRQIMQQFSSFRSMSHANVSEWKKLKGLGLAKICQIKAAIEIGRRFGEEDKAQSFNIIESSKDVVHMLMPRMRDLRKEVFKVLFLDAKNRLIKLEEMNEGTVNYCRPIIREVYERALHLNAVSLICVHNHPSGHARPSPEDEQFTQKLYEAGQILQIQLLDHIIIGNNCHYSFSDEGKI